EHPRIRLIRRRTALELASGCVEIRGPEAAPLVRQRSKGVPSRLTCQSSDGGTPVDAKYHVDQVVGPDADDEIRSALEQLAREGARQMLEWALEAEVEEFLGRERYARSTEFRGYRNGFQRPREVVMGAWSVPVRAPRVSDVPEGCSGFESEILPKKQRLTHDTQLLFA